MSWEARFARRLIAAVPVPFRADAQIDRDVQMAYARHFSGRPCDGVAVWAHTGRGLNLTPEQRRDVLNDWRGALGPDRLVVAAAGAPRTMADDLDAAFSVARAMASQAAELGADAVLVHPPTFARGRSDLDRIVLDYHAAIASAGLPMILFYLYENAGGISYPPAVIAELLARPDVVGMKVATLDGVMTFQDIAGLFASRFPDKVLITGEDRFLGYSLMCGARGALIGMASACCEIQAALLASHFDGDAARFLALSRQVDRLSFLTFRAPMEGYIRRMLWCLAHEGVIPESATHDPWGPELPRAEFDAIGAFIRETREG